MNLILGAGLSGISASYHLGHENCLILEKNSFSCGHIHSRYADGFTWDEGPHVSFTKNEYVKELFEQSVAGEFEEFDVRTANYFQGHWIDHPAQSSLHQVPEPLRSQCLQSFLESRLVSDVSDLTPPLNYQEWLVRAFGRVFTETFPSVYTKKYWTREPRELTTDWIGDRVFYPKVEDVVEGSRGLLNRQTHYITRVRYPKTGGYEAFARHLINGSRITNNACVAKIDLKNKKVLTVDGGKYSYSCLINTLPLPEFVRLCAERPDEVKEAAESLSCSQLLLVNVIAPHPTQRPENWMYVYDPGKFSTRINCTEKLAPGNAPAGWTGVQVEVYSSKHCPLTDSPKKIGRMVVDELIEMGLVVPELVPSRSSIHFHTISVPWANVIFDHATRPALTTIWQWLESHGLSREQDDLYPLTKWDESGRGTSETPGTLVMAGRFGQWKYFWTDDCILRGRSLATK